MSRRSRSSWADVVYVWGDIVAIAAVTVVATAAIFLLPAGGTAIRPLLALALLLFAPGYALLLALYPKGATGPTLDPLAPASRSPVSDSGGLDAPERAALSFGLSLTLVPFYALVFSLAGIGYALVPLVWLLDAVIAVGLAAGVLVRVRRRPASGADVDAGGWFRSLVGVVTRPTDRADVALNVVLVVSVLLATSGLAYAVASPNQGMSYNEMALLTETDDGDLVAHYYPTDLEQGAERSLVVTVENQEHRRVSYTVVAELQRVSKVNGTQTVQERERLTRLQTTLDDNETARLPHTIAPTMTGENLRLSYYLYRGEAPETPSAETASKHLYLWVNVTATG